MAKTLVLLLLPLCVLGCRSMDGLRADRRAGERGTEAVYHKDLQALWDASKAVLKDSGAEALEEVKDTNEIFTAFPSSFFSAGTIACVYFEKQGDAWRVGAISRRRMPTNIATAMTEGHFHDALKAKLK
jgi:hypothetical protein